MKRCNLIIIALLFCLVSPSDATIYKWVDDHGETHFTDDPGNIPEKAKEKAQNFDKIEHKGSVTYDPDVKSPEPQTGEEPFWKRYLQQEEEKEQAKRSKEPEITLYMADW
jgi:hypothetical protein